MSLEDFLSQQATGQRDSEGGFTLNTRAALRKLGQGSFVHESDYLLKLVQAAHCLEAKEISFRLTRQHWSVTFLISIVEEIQPQAMAEAIQVGSSEKCDASKHLLAALLGAADVEQGEIVYQLGSGFLKVSEGIDFVPNTKKSGFEALSIVCQRPPSTWYNKLCWWKDKSAVLAHKAIYDSCRYSAARVLVDGRPIERGWRRALPSSKKACWYKKLSLHCYLAEAYLDDAELPKFPFQSWDPSHFAPTQLKGIFTRKDSTWEKQGLDSLSVFSDFQAGSQFSCALAAAVKLELEGPALLFFYLDGLISAPVFVEAGIPGLVCIASGAGLETDLSGFRVVEDSNYQKRVDTIASRIKHFKKALLDGMGHLLDPEAVPANIVADAEPSRSHHYRRSHTSFLKREVESRLIAAF